MARRAHASGGSIPHPSRMNYFTRPRFSWIGLFVMSFLGGAMWQAFKDIVLR